MLIVFGVMRQRKTCNKTSTQDSPDAIARAIAFAAGPAVFDLDAKELDEPAGGCFGRAWFLIIVIYKSIFHLIVCS